MQNFSPGEVPCDECKDCEVEPRLNTYETTSLQRKKELRLKLRQRLCKKF